MSRRRRGKAALKEKGTESANMWIGLSAIGYLAVGLFSFFGLLVFTNSVIVSGLLALVLVVGLIFINYGLEKAKVSGETANKAVLFILFFALSLTAAVFATHYLDTVYGSGSSILTTKKKKLENTKDLYRQYNSYVGQVKSAFEGCDFDVLSESLGTIAENNRKSVNPPLNQLNTTIWPPSLINIFRSEDSYSYDDAKEIIDQAVEDHNDLATESECEIKSFQAKIKHGDIDDEAAFINSPMASLSGSPLWFLLIWIFTAGLMMIPYFMAQGATSILRFRK